MHLPPTHNQPPTTQIPSQPVLSHNILRASTPLLSVDMPSNTSSRSASPAPRLPIDPSANGSTTHHRPAFAHASTSHHIPSVNSQSTPIVTNYDFPPEKEAPPAYSPNHDDHHRPPFSHHFSNSHVHGHAFAHASRASSRRSSTVAVPDPCMLHCIRDKLLGKEGGIGRALMLGWVLTTLGFIIATAFWKGELFGALDRLSKNLLAMGLEGKLIFLLLIFITTIPPLPLYSTLMVLSGYTFGVWEGFVVSYVASLLGAVLVFVISRTILRDVITKSTSPTAQSLLAIIPANPHLLLLIRIAPYPYNLLNVILASAPSLSLRTYTACTAISLLKLVLHTWIGAGIHDIASFGRKPHGPPGNEDLAGEWSGQNEEHHRHGHYGVGAGRYGHHRPQGYGHGHGGGGWREAERHRAEVRMYSTWVGIGLCVALFFYLTHLAKKALKKAQEEEALRQEGEEMLLGTDEEC